MLQEVLSLKLKSMPEEEEKDTLPVDSKEELNSAKHLSKSEIIPNKWLDTILLLIKLLKMDY